MKLQNMINIILIIELRCYFCMDGKVFETFDLKEL
jgi:hypothetical protein